MSRYTADAAGALADVTAAGAPVTFTQSAPGTYDESTGTFSGAAVTTVSGSAVRVQGDPKLYETLSLVALEAVTLFFTPSTFGAVPTLGATFVWGATTYTVRWTNPIAPDGTAIACRVVGSV